MQDVMGFFTSNPHFMSCGGIWYVKTILVHLYSYGMLGKTPLPSKINDGMVGADLYTFPAGGTFIIINNCKIVLYMNGIVWTYLFTLFAGDTRILAYFFCNG